MKKVKCEQMNAEEKEFIKFVCTTRSKHSAGIFAGMFAIVGYFMMRGRLYQDISFIYLVLIDTIFSLLCAVVVFAVSALSYCRDVLGCQVFVMEYQIIDKVAFPEVSQYYIKLDDVLNPFLEVSPEDYVSLQIGQIQKIRIAKHSRYRFNNMGKYQRM
ncbi:hypothetical protein DBR32_03400 [Taibaiella sp. KBW10]|uniref:hypothetical protein n=1 Tax=Taibaiella sp. KBW10 TaxID=2153357 RepID=UPI000F59F31D|nr:hypothetical protein [Taibaiella sp. KBW10]RQO31863.1 hypothetical protein DBR32_03400 [Taibaiella sp. KBW10]